MQISTYIQSLILKITYSPAAYTLNRENDTWLDYHGKEPGESGVKYWPPNQFLPMWHFTQNIRGKCNWKENSLAFSKQVLWWVPQGKEVWLHFSD